MSSTLSAVFDPAPVRAAYAVFQTARQKLENERFEMLIEVRQILTYGQWQKIQDDAKKGIWQKIKGWFSR